MDDAGRAARERGLRKAVLAGDERAWREWYDESFSALDTYVAWRCGGLRDLADDVVQETWLVAVRRIRDFDATRGTFLAWLCGIAANVVRGRLRARQRRSQPATSIHAELHVAAARMLSADEEDPSERIARALDALPDPYERVLRGKYLDQRSVVELAAEWDVTPKSIESLLTRARQAFREAYTRQESTP